MSASRLLLSVSLLKLRVAIIVATPFAAYAAEQTIYRAGDASDLTLWTWVVLFCFAMLGWTVADLDKVAELWNVEGKHPYEIWKGRLTLLKGVAASNLAGVGTFFLGKLAPGALLSALGVPGSASANVPELALLLGAAAGGYMGTRWFDAIERRMTK